MDLSPPPPASEEAHPFQHEKLLVYGLATDFLSRTHAIAARLPRTRVGVKLADQLQTAALSISLNIAEGSAEYSTLEKVKFYRYAVRSAGECAAALDAVSCLSPMNARAAAEGKSVLHRITAMLLGLIRHHERR